MVDVPKVEERYKNALSVATSMPLAEQVCFVLKYIQSKVMDQRNRNETKECRITCNYT